MTKKDLKLNNLPDKPGVYMFRGSRREILYIGKAASFRDRVRSYFVGLAPSRTNADWTRKVAEGRSPLITEMIEKAKKVDFIETDSVLEALILEANLIKKHQPPYNTKEKSDKSFNYVVITDEEFPRVFTMRGRELSLSSGDSPHTEGGRTVPVKIFVPIKLKSIYGPFPQGNVLKEALQIIRKIFPFLDKRAGTKGNKEFYRQLGLAPALVGSDPTNAARKYKKTIRNIKLFFEGKKKTLIKKLEKEMKNVSKKEEFEKAARLRNQIFALNHINDVSLIKDDPHSIILQNYRMRIEAYDVAHISGKSMVGVMTVVEDGEVARNDYRKFKIREYDSPNDSGALKEIMERRFGHPEWRGPGLIVVDGGKAQLNTAERVLKNLDLPIPVVAVVKDEFHRPKKILGERRLVRKHEKEILLVNSEAHHFAISYHRLLRKKAMIRN